MCTDYYFTVSTKFVISFYPITAVLTSYTTNKTMKRFMADARLQNKTILLTRGWQFVFGGFLRSAEDQRLSFMIVSSYQLTFLVHNQCVTLQILVNFNIASFIL